MLFRDRIDAGQKLATALRRFAGDDCVIYALPRGGLPIGFEIAKLLRAPLDIILVRKIGVPFQPELALGAVVDGDHPEIVLNDSVVSAIQPSEGAISVAAAKELKEIERRRIIYMAGRQAQPAHGRTAIIVDDGLATGSTARAAVRAVRRQHPKRLILAVPVAPRETVAELGCEVDELICLESPDNFGAVSMYYAAFPQVTDQEAVVLLAQARDLLRQPSA